MAALSTSTWGDPTANKHVLLIHGITASSQIWHRVAKEFTSRGYLVTAPDLLGHGTARRGTDYTVAALAQELQPLFTANRHYDFIVGHSLGGVVASALLPLLESSRPVQVVLADPPLEVSPEGTVIVRKAFGDSVRNPVEPEALLQVYPSLTREDAILRNASLRLCDAAAVEAILDQNVPWSFSENLRTVPENVKVTVLAADPSKGPCVREEELKPYPHVTAKTVWGASHLIPLEDPQVIIETAFGGTDLSN